MMCDGARRHIEVHKLARMIDRVEPMGSFDACRRRLSWLERRFGVDADSLRLRAIVDFMEVLIVE